MEYRTVDHPERAGRLLVVLVVTERVAATEGEDADLVGSRNDLPAVVLQHLDVRPQRERRCRGGVARARDGHAHADRF
jgi:hypothetical protein